MLTFAPKKTARALVFSAPALVDGDYHLYTGGSHSGSANDRLYEEGTYTPGSLFANFTISGTLTTLGTGRGGPPPGGR